MLDALSSCVTIGRLMFSEVFDVLRMAHKANVRTRSLGASLVRDNLKSRLCLLLIITTTLLSFLSKLLHHTAHAQDLRPPVHVGWTRLLESEQVLWERHL